MDSIFYGADWFRVVRLCLAMVGLLVWSGLVLHSALDRWSVITNKQDTDLHILSDGDVLGAIAGFLGFAFLTTANVIALAPESQTVVVLVLQTLGYTMFACMGAAWYQTLQRFRAYHEHARDSDKL